MSRKEIDRYYHELRLRNNFLDLFQAPRFALKFKILFVGFTGIVISYFLCLLASFLTVLIFSEYHSSFNFVGLIPVVLPHIDLPVQANLILFIGYILAASCLSMTSAGISMTITEYLKGDRDFSLNDIRQFLSDNYSSILMTPMGFIVIIMFFFAIGIIFSLMTKLPVFGLLIYFFNIPILCIIGIFLVFSVFAMINGILFLPAISATWGKDMLSIIFQSYSILWARPWKIIFGILVSVWNSIISFTGLFFLFQSAFWVVRRFSEMGILATAKSGFPIFSIEFFTQTKIVSDISNMPKSSIILVVWYLIAFITSISFALGSFISTQTMLFVHIKKDENDIHLLKI